jgi:hypothetical protein
MTNHVPQRGALLACRPICSSVRRHAPTPPHHMKSILVRLAVLALPVAVSGCISHAVKFDRASYSVPKAAATASATTAVVAVISPETLAEKKTISAWMTGIAHKWDAEPGMMLKDVAEIEFSQAYSSHEIASAYAEPKSGDRRLTVELSIPSYDFSDFHASISVHAVIYGPGQTKRLEKTYSAEGIRQGAKMFWGGAFSMKSAIRQSSLAAYKKIFAELRADMDKVFESP